MWDKIALFIKFVSLVIKWIAAKNDLRAREIEKGMDIVKEARRSGDPYARHKALDRLRARGL
jgi:hypothetical protein